MKKIKTLGLLSERTSIKEMAIVSSSADKELVDIDIFVYGNEHRPRHASVVQKSNHSIALGRFEITDHPPRIYADVKELKEPLESGYKKEIADWANKQSNMVVVPITNWDLLKTTWNILNLNLDQK
jgi:hypothetical protein